MKVQELRQRLQAADREYIEKAFVESYKQLRKEQKEEIDAVLIEILEGKDTGKKKTINALGFEDLEKQITEFIKNAYAQNYFAPNRIIPKNQRPKWRFLVKNFIRELEKIPLESDNYSKSVKLLADLYHLICKACNYYLFSADDPFRSIGWSQPDFFQLLVSRTFAAGYSREAIAKLLVDAVTGGLSRESLYICQELVLLDELKTSDVKYIAIEEAKKIVEEAERELSGLRKYDNRQYYLEEKVNECCAVIFIVSISLAEPEKGMEYYFKHCRKKEKEIMLYCALNLVKWLEEDDLWIKVYEYGIRKKIKPRSSLQSEYREKKRIIQSSNGTDKKRDV